MPFLHHYFSQTPPLQVNNSVSNFGTVDPAWNVFNQQLYFNEYMYTSLPTFPTVPKQQPQIDDKAMADKHVECGMESLIKEAHQERLNNLRKLLKEIEDDNWKYENRL